MYVFPLLYAAAAFVGTFTTVAIVWNLADIVNAGLLILNITALLWFIATIRGGLKKYENQRI